MVFKLIKEKIIGWIGSISGAASILGSWQVCHNICLALIAALSIAGITVTGMPLLFFTKIAVPIWLIAVALFALVIYFYFKKHCISRNLIFLNLGLIIAGIPFQSLKPYQIVFWIIGGVIAIIGIIMYIKDKVEKRK